MLHCYLLVKKKKRKKSGWRGAIDAPRVKAYTDKAGVEEEIGLAS